MQPGRLYVTFWGLKPSNFPQGITRRRRVDAATAKELIQIAHACGRLSCARSDALLAPYLARALSCDQALRAALEEIDISIGIEDFLVQDGECQHTFPLGLAQLEPGDQLLVIDCHRELDRGEEGHDFPSLFSIRADSISFHLFEAANSAEIGTDPRRSDHLQPRDREASPIQGRPSVADSLAGLDGMDPETDESVRKAAIAAFGAGAANYLHSPNFALGGRSPAEVLRRPDGLQIVLAEIQAQQDGALIKMSEREARLNNVRRLAIKEFGSRKAAEEWLQTEQRALNFRRPVDLIATDAGFAKVEELLARIRYGVFT